MKPIFVEPRGKGTFTEVTAIAISHIITVHSVRVDIDAIIMLTQLDLHKLSVSAALKLDSLAGD